MPDTRRRKSKTTSSTKTNADASTPSGKSIGAHASQTVRTLLLSAFNELNETVSTGTQEKCSASLCCNRCVYILGHFCLEWQRQALEFNVT